MQKQKYKIPVCLRHYFQLLASQTKTMCMHMPTFKFALKDYFTAQDEDNNQEKSNPGELLGQVTKRIHGIIRTYFKHVLHADHCDKTI